MAQELITVRGYWRPDTESQAVPEISVGYDISMLTDRMIPMLICRTNLEGYVPVDDKIGIAGQPQTADTE